MNTYQLPVDLRISNTILVRITLNNEGLFSDECYFLPIIPYSPGDDINLQDLSIPQAISRMYFNAAAMNPGYRYMLPFLMDGDYNGYSAEAMAKLFVATDLMGLALAKYRNYDYKGIPENVFFEENFAALINKLHPNNN